MLAAMDVAKFFINLFKDTEDGVTNLKLQKLLYYAQGISFQRFGTPLFDEEIEAWEHGPVVNTVYQKYKSYTQSPIRDSEEVDLSIDEEDLLMDVAREYGKYAAWTLVDMTHKDGTPWKQCYIDGVNHMIIPKDIIKDYFTSKEIELTSIDWDHLISQSHVVDLTKGNNISAKEW